MVGQVLAVASGKGGVGKTTTVVNLGVVLRRADHTVALVDADLGMANLATMLGISAESTLHDVLAGEATVEEAVVEEAAGFGIVAGSGDLRAYPDADPRALGDVLAALAESYDYVLVDTGAGMSHEDVLPLGLADRVILVTSPDPAAIGDTRKTAELADLARGALAGVVVTMADESTDANDVAAEVGVELLGVIPFDATVRSSTATATPLEAVDPDGPAAVAYRELASTLVDGLPEATAPTSEGANAGQPPEEPRDAADADDAEPEPAAAPEVEADAVTDAADAADGTGEETATEAAEAAETASAEETPPDEPDEAAEAGADDAAASEDQPAEEAAAPEAADESADEAPVAEEDPAADGVADEASEDTPDDAEATEAEEPAADEAVEDDEAVDEEELDDYLEEFEDAETASSGGFFSRLRRLFR